MIRNAPYFINWNYTYTCNFNCSHCYSRAPKYPKELSTKEYINIVNQFIELQIFRVGLGGGEPLIRKDCINMVQRMGDAGIYVLLTSNGWFIKKETAKKLKKAKLALLALSIDSIDPIKHDFFRKKEGSFNRVIEATKNSVNEGLNVYFSIVLNKTNIDEIEPMISLAESLNISGVHFKLFRPAGNGLSNIDKYSLSNEDINNIVNTVDSKKKQTNINLSLYQKDSSNGCNCGVDTLTLRPNGDISFCPYQEATFTNIIENPLRNIWKDSIELEKRRKDNYCIAETAQKYPSNPYLNQDSILDKLIN